MNAVIAMQQNVSGEQELATIKQIAEMDGLSVEAIQKRIAKWGIKPTIETVRTAAGTVAAKYDLALYRAKVAAAAEEVLLARDKETANKMIAKSKEGAIAEVIMQKLQDFEDAEDEASVDYLLTKTLAAKVAINKKRCDKLENLLAIETSKLEEEILQHGKLKDKTDTGERYFSVLRVSQIFEQSGKFHEFMIDKSSTGKELSSISRELGNMFITQETAIDKVRRLYHVDVWKVKGIDVLAQLDELATKE